jgi:hypothetical protein
MDRTWWSVLMLSVGCGGHAKTEVSPPPASPRTASCARKSPPTASDLADDPAMSGHFGGPGLPSGGGPPCERGKTRASFEIGAPASSSADFDPAILRDVMEKHKGELLSCYTREACPRLFSYEMSACFTVDANGAVELADADSVNANIRSCTVGVLSALHFQKPSHPFEVTYRLTYNAK